jgi:hypothetical protein
MQNDDFFIAKNADFWMMKTHPILAGGGCCYDDTGV